MAAILLLWPQRLRMPQYGGQSDNRPWIAAVTQAEQPSGALGCDANTLPLLAASAIDMQASSNMQPEPGPSSGPRAERQERAAFPSRSLLGKGSLPRHRHSAALMRVSFADTPPQRLYVTGVGTPSFLLDFAASARDHMHSTTQTLQTRLIDRTHPHR